MVFFSKLSRIAFLKLNFHDNVHIIFITVKCVPGSNQAYSSSNSEKSISLLASFNTKMAETWQTGNIGNLFCEKEGYWRSFNYNYDNAGYTSVSLIKYNFNVTTL